MVFLLYEIEQALPDVFQYSASVLDDGAIDRLLGKTSSLTIRIPVSV